MENGTLTFFETFMNHIRKFIETDAQSAINFYHEIYKLTDSESWSCAGQCYSRNGSSICKFLSVVDFDCDGVPMQYNKCPKWQEICKFSNSAYYNLVRKAELLIKEETNKAWASGDLICRKCHSGNRYSLKVYYWNFLAVERFYKNGEIIHDIYLKEIRLCRQCGDNIPKHKRCADQQFYLWDPIRNYTRSYELWEVTLRCLIENRFYYIDKYHSTTSKYLELVHAREDRLDRKNKK